MEATIRRAVPADAPALGALHSRVWPDLYPKALPPAVLAQLSPAYMQDLWEKFTARGGDYKQWVAEVNGQIVGFAGVGPGREEGHETESELYFLYLAPVMREEGIGTQLLKTADPDYLWVWEGFKGARKFYAAQQYVPDMVRATRGMGQKSRVNVLFGSAYLTELRMIRKQPV